MTSQYRVESRVLDQSFFFVVTTEEEKCDANHRIERGNKYDLWQGREVRVRWCIYRFGDKVQQVYAQADFLLVVARAEGEGHLVVTSVHHVLVPLAEAAQDGRQHTVDLHTHTQIRFEVRLSN